MGLIYLDSCIVIYALEDETDDGVRTRVRLADELEHQFAISPLVKLECLVGPLRSANQGLQRSYENRLAEFRNLSIDEDVFLSATDVRARFGLKTPDALHLATALVHGCVALWTNDNRLAAASHYLAVDILDR